MSRKHDLAIANATDYLREREERGATVTMIGAALGYSARTHIGRAMKIGRELGLFVAHEAPEGNCRNRLAYYLPQFKPAAFVPVKTVLRERTAPVQKTGNRTNKAAELARQPGGAAAADAALALGVPSRLAAERLWRSHIALGIFRATRHEGKSLRCRYFGTEEEAAAWGEVTKPPTKQPRAKFAGGKQPTGQHKPTNPPTFVDSRYAWTRPPGYVSALDPNDCRPWARAATA